MQNVKPPSIWWAPTMLGLVVLSSIVLYSLSIPIITVYLANLLIILITTVVAWHQVHND